MEVKIWQIFGRVNKKKDRYGQFLKILKDHDGEELNKILALAELTIGINRATALSYLNTFKDAGLVTVVKGKAILIKKGGNL